MTNGKNTTEIGKGPTGKQGPELGEDPELQTNQRPQANTVGSTRKSLGENMSLEQRFDSFLETEGVPSEGQLIVKQYIKEKCPIMLSLVYSTTEEDGGKSVFFNNKIMPKILDYYIEKVRTDPGTKLTEYWVSKMLEGDKVQEYIPILIEELKYRISKGIKNAYYTGNNNILITKLLSYQPSIIISEFSLFSTVYRPEYMIDILKSEITELNQKEINQLFGIINRRIGSGKEQSAIFNDIFYEILKSYSSTKEFLETYNEANSNELQKGQYKIKQANIQKYREAIYDLVNSLDNCNSKLNRNIFLELIKLNYGKKIIRLIDKFEGLKDNDYMELYLSYYNDIHNCNPVIQDINVIFDKVQELGYEDINLLVSIMKHTSLGKGKEKKLLITNLILEKINKGRGDYCEILNGHYKGYFDTIVIGSEKTRLVNYLVKKGFTTQCNIGNMLKDLDITLLNPEEIKELRTSFYY